MVVQIAVAFEVAPTTAVSALLAGELHPTRIKFIFLTDDIGPTNRRSRKARRSCLAEGVAYMRPRVLTHTGPSLERPCKSIVSQILAYEKARPRHLC